MDFKGKQLELRGWLRVRDVKDYATLWLRVDDAGGTPLVMDNGAAQHHNGTTEWEPFHVSVALGPEARGVVFGAFLSGPGTLDLVVEYSNGTFWSPPTSWQSCCRKCRSFKAEDF